MRMECEAGGIVTRYAGARCDIARVREGIVGPWASALTPGPSPADAGEGSKASSVCVDGFCPSPASAGEGGAQRRVRATASIPAAIASKLAPTGTRRRRWIGRVFAGATSGRDTASEGRGLRCTPPSRARSRPPALSAPTRRRCGWGRRSWFRAGWRSAGRGRAGRRRFGCSCPCAEVQKKTGARGAGCAHPVQANTMRRRCPGLLSRSAGSAGGVLSPSSA